MSVRIVTWRGERFGRGDADLRPGVHVDAAIAFAGDGARHVVANAEGAMAFALALAQGRERIGRLAALRDDEDERVLRQRHVAIAELARELDLRGDVREMLDDVFADHGRVAAVPQPREDDALDGAQLRVAHLEAAELGRGLFAAKGARAWHR